VRFFHRIAEKRDDIILSRARPHLDDGEEVIHWARARRHGSNDDGFVYVTERRLVVHWSRRDHGHYMIPWERVTAWGISESGGKGPILAIESPDERAEVQLKVGTEASASRVRGFLDVFGELAPIPRRALHPTGKMGEVAEWHPNVQRERRSVAGHTQRVMVTIIGVGLIVLAALIIPVPGPWSFILTLGGLAVLAREYDWAQDVRDWVHDRYKEAAKKIKNRKRS
jgi:uncharacterized protein (TIGR02611 family)